MELLAHDRTDPIENFTGTVARRPWCPVESTGDLSNRARLMPSATSNEKNPSIGYTALRVKLTNAKVDVRSVLSDELACGEIESAVY